jgi:hypothetical protein
MNMSVEIMGWIGSLLIVGSYALNITGKLEATNKWYVWANIIGGFLFIINTYFHQAYPSMFVNIVWVIIAFVMIFKNKGNNSF